MIGMLAPVQVIAENNIESSLAHDPGLRGGSAGAGNALLGLDSTQQEFFASGKQNFQTAELVANGLGPRFNLDSCGGCHAYPAPGGSSPAANPQIAVAAAYGAKNTIPSFLSINGPVRVVRFITTPEGAPDGDVHGLFVISGRNDGADASGCTAAQENFDAQAANHNVSFRIPTPLFGLGLIEQISDNALEANLAGNLAQKQSLGIQGHLNKIGGNGDIGRYGWKAQHASMVLFSSEAYNAEMGLTNQEYPLERDNNPACRFASSPRKANLYAGDYSGFMTLSEKNAYFMRYLAPPAPSSSMPGGNAAIARGGKQFSMVGCDNCHTPAIGGVSLFSDLALHKMGPGLADGVQQGLASADEFRTAPLWGLGQRIFFLHDGRTSDLLQAIREHSSDGDGVYQLSEAIQVVKNFSRLSENDKQDLLDFLRSL
jgi:CxxC motif-containing protein (DUF1111 family)